MIEQERVGRLPMQIDGGSRSEQLVRTGVLLEHRYFLSPGHAHQILRADADKTDVGDETPLDDIDVIAALIRGCGEVDLLRPHADPHASLLHTGARPVDGDDIARNVYLERA